MGYIVSTIETFIYVGCVIYYGVDKQLFRLIYERGLIYMICKKCKRNWSWVACYNLKCANKNCGGDVIEDDGSSPIWDRTTHNAEIEFKLRGW